jgi:hypothetical protein
MTTVNLLPAHRRRALRSRAHLRLWLRLAAAYAVLLLLGAVWIHVVRSAGTGSEEGELRRLQERGRQTGVALAATRKELATLHSDEQLASVFVEQPDWTEFLRLVSARLGPAMVLRDFRIQPAGAAPQMAAARNAAPALAAKAVAPAGNYRLEMRGAARAQADVGKFVSSLEDLKLFDQVRLLRTAREPFLEATATGFELECRFHEAGER